MKTRVAVLSILAVTIFGAPLIASASTPTASTPTASTTQHHVKTHSKHAKKVKHKSSESQASAPK